MSPGAATPMALAGAGEPAQVRGAQAPVAARPRRPATERVEASPGTRRRLDESRPSGSAALGLPQRHE